MSVLKDHPSIFDGDAAARGDVDRDQATILDGRVLVASAVVDVLFADGPIIVDTSEINSRRVVTVEVPGLGPVPLLPHEALTFARALLSRLAVVGFPEDAMTSADRGTRSCGLCVQSCTNACAQAAAEVGA